MSVIMKTLDIVLRGAGAIFFGLIGLSVYSAKNPKGARVRDRELKAIMFEDEESASTTLKLLREIAHVRTTVSYFDLFDILNSETDQPYDDRRWGWSLSDLQGVRVYRDGDIWRIKLPKVSRLYPLARRKRS